MTATTEYRLAGVFARTSTPELVRALRSIDGSPFRTPELARTRAWLIEELERRHPDAAHTVEAAVAAADADERVDYVAVLTAAIPTKDGA